jgi:putative phosphoribosyl transferase
MRISAQSQPGEMATSNRMVELKADLTVPFPAVGLVILANGSEKSRLSLQNQELAQMFQQHGLGTLLFDLFTEEEEQVFGDNGNHLPNISLLARRLVEATAWVSGQEHVRRLPVGYFGMDTGTAAALMAAAQLGDGISSIVSCSGKPELAADVLHKVESPTLLIVGGRDIPSIDISERTSEWLKCEKAVTVVPRATRSFEEPGVLPTVGRLASEWFDKYFRRGVPFYGHPARQYAC